MTLKTPLRQIQGIGPRYLTLLKKLEIVCVGDLVTHFPTRFEDLSQIKKMADLTIGEVVTVRGSIWEIQNIRTRTGKFMTKATVNDGSASLSVVWFNQPYLTKSLKVGQSISLAGKVAFFNSRLSLTSPDWEIYQTGRHTGRLVPIYPETSGLSSKWLRNKIALILPQVLTMLDDPLPTNIRRKYQLMPYPEAIQSIHLPKSGQEVEQARRRLGFDELFVLNLASQIRKSIWQSFKGTSLKFSKDKIDQFITGLPFKLTSDQSKVVSEILADLAKTHPMNRLLQGDVGGGKTVVAAIAVYATYLSGFKTLFMAPTSILAEQHLATLTKLLTPLGLSIGIQTGAKKSGLGDVVVGTHSLLYQPSDLDQVGLVIVDEQHRFGVSQRSLLRTKGDSPHLLSLTATPIPRTLALSLYGDLDLSVLNELPPGRGTVKTYLTPPDKRTAAYQFIREKISLGQQGFVITPLIEPSESLTTVRSVKEEYDRLSQDIFPELRLGLLHGRLKSSEKDQVLTSFREKRIDLLVSTPVVEVGIDIPNATVMIIEGAERFGMATLHQLRGRIGRGDQESWCLLFSTVSSPESDKRLQFLASHNKGAELAELDLKKRGFGELYGLRQSGLPNLKIASLADFKLLQETHLAAEEYLASRPKLPRSLTTQLEPLLKGQAAPD